MHTLVVRVLVSEAGTPQHASNQRRLRRAEAKTRHNTGSLVQGGRGLGLWEKKIIETDPCLGDFRRRGGFIPPLPGSSFPSLSLCYSPRRRAVPPPVSCLDGKFETGSKLFLGRQYTC